MGKIAILFVSALVLTSSSACAQSGDNRTHGYEWNSPPRRPHIPDWKQNVILLPHILVAGNRLVDDRGDTIVFRGVSIADPDKIEQEGKWSRKIFSEARAVGARIIRIPVHPGAWKARTAENYLTLLDQAVEWCTEESLYVDIDWHSIGNLEEGLYEQPVYYTDLQETFNFWKVIAQHFAGANTVAFLELFNEPTDGGGRLGNLSWEKWKKINEDLIKLIRANGNTSIPLVAGFDWAYDLAPLRYDPVDADGIGYVVHPYPHKRTPPYTPKWDEDFGFASAKYPIVATELGFTLPTLKANQEYGEEIVGYFRERHISWIWWVFDPLWRPAMLESWSTFKLTPEGQFFENVSRGDTTESTKTPR